MTYPTTYPATFPTLLLDFANRKALDPRITFTRASTATYYDEETTVKGDQNLIPNSLGFGGFSGTSITVTTNKTAPDGTGNARRLSFGITGSTSYSYTFSNLHNYTQLTFSVWIKRISGSGTIKISAGDTNVTQSITTSWARYSVTQTVATGGDLYIGVRGDTITPTDAIEIWGPQLETGPNMTGYLQTTTAPITNYIPRLMTAATNVARFDHDPITREPLGLLIEEQRANLVTYAEDFSNAAWAKNSGVTITANANIAPDGNLTADKLNETTIAAGLSGVSRTISGLTNGTTYTASVYAKAGERKYIYMSAGNRELNADLINGVITFTNGTATIKNVGGGWWRITLQFTAVGTSAVLGFYLAYPVVVSTKATGNGIYLWGAQLEAGAFATSYIPTAAASVTRSADAANMTGTNFSSWYRADEGAFLVEAATFAPASGAVGRILSLSISGSESTETNRVFTYNGKIGGNTRFSGISQSDLQPFTYTTNTAFKFAYGYRLNDFAAVGNGGTIFTDTSGNVPINLNEMGIGSVSGTGPANVTIKKIAYYPSRLTNAQLQGLTT
jgi:hypothetical protein